MCVGSFQKPLKTDLTIVELLHTDLLVHVDLCLSKTNIWLCSTKPRFLISGTLIFPHNSQNMTYFVTKFGMLKFCVVP